MICWKVSIRLPLSRSFCLIWFPSQNSWCICRSCRQVVRIVPGEHALREMRVPHLKLSWHHLVRPFRRADCGDFCVSSIDLASLLQIPWKYWPLMKFSSKIQAISLSASLAAARSCFQVARSISVPGALSDRACCAMRVTFFFASGFTCVTFAAPEDSDRPLRT